MCLALTTLAHLRLCLPRLTNHERERGRGGAAALLEMGDRGPDVGVNPFDTKNYDSKMEELKSDADFATWDEVHETFDAMGLKENLLRGIYAYGFEKPSAIQQRGIVPVIKGIDVIQQAQSGTGKTATFCTGILNQIDYSTEAPECQVFFFILLF